MNIHNQHFILRSERAWPARARLGLHPGAPNAPLDFLPLRGKTAGLLGYGHIARETARLLKAFGVEVIAANTRGEQSKDEGVRLLCLLCLLRLRMSSDGRGKGRADGTVHYPGHW